jgi:thymidine kinase
MFSGKTTYLCHKAEAASYIGKVLYIIHSLETRTSAQTGIYSHNKSLNLMSPKYDVIYTSTLKNIADEFFNNYSTVCIDEAQFFDDLYDDIARIVFKLKKDVHVAGLSGTSERRHFNNGEILKLIPLATDFILLKSAFCQRCSTINKKTIANYTHCHDTHKTGDILIGGNSLYMPVCGECWEVLNKKNDESRAE